MTTVPQRGQDRVSLSIGTRNASWNDIPEWPRAILRGVAEQLWEQGITTELGAWTDAAQYLMLSFGEHEIGRLLLWPSMDFSLCCGEQVNFPSADPGSIPRIIAVLEEMIRTLRTP